MNDGARPVVADVTDRLSSELVEAEDLDTLARTLLTGLMGPGTFPCVHGAALGLVEGGGRRLRLLSSDHDPGAPVRGSAWTHLDAYDDGPLTRVVRTREPVLGCAQELEAVFPAFCRERQLAGTTSVAVLPLEPVPSGPMVAPSSPGRPLGALALYYECAQGFDVAQRHELAVLARVVGYSLEQLCAGSGPHPVAPDLRPDAAAEAAAEAATVLPNDERAPSTARRFLRERLEAWEVSEDISATAQLCLSELVTNAVIHAGSSSVLLIAMVEGMLEVCVRDHGGPPETRVLAVPVIEEDDSLPVHGRGLLLVDSLSSSWGADTLADGRSVWFTLAVEHAG